jgi:hypothetical protein
MSGNNTFSTTSRRADSRISLWRMIQPGGGSQVSSRPPEIIRKPFRRMPFTFLGELQRKVQLFYINAFFIAHPTCVVPVQSLGLVCFILFGPPCTPVDLWSGYLAARVYVQYVSSDGRCFPCTIGACSGEGHHGPKCRADPQPRGTHRASRGQDRYHGEPGNGLPSRCTYGAAPNVVEEQAGPWPRRPRRSGAEALLSPTLFCT